jgi:hypothetical protein
VGTNIKEDYDKLKIEFIEYKIANGISINITALHKIKNVLIVLTSRMTDREMVYPALSRIEIRAKKEFDETKLNFSIYNNGTVKKEK